MGYVALFEIHWFMFILNQVLLYVVKLAMPESQNLNLCFALKSIYTPQIFAVLFFDI